MSIIVIGDSCLDKFFYGTCDRLSPEAPVPVLKFTSVQEMPGMAANVAENAKAFSDNVTLVTQNESITKSRFIDAKTKQHILRFDEESTVNSKVDNSLDVTSYDVVIISDYCKGFLETLDKDDSIFDKTVYVDTKRSDVSCFRNSFIKVNEKESKEISTKSIPESSKLITTLGGKGALYDKRVYPTEEVDIFDVSGAGDTFLACFSIFHAVTKDISASINFANKCASLVVQKPGTAPITRENIR